MTLNLTIPQNQHTDFTPRITVVGVCGGVVSLGFGLWNSVCMVLG